MQIKVRSGEYGKAPQDKEPVEVTLPNDAIFYTPGEAFINHGLHKGALHYIVLTKASDEELKEFQKWNVHVELEYDMDSVHTRYFRMNGYAFITLSDCIIDSPIDTVDEEEFNRLIKDDLYYVLLNENYNIICIRRVDHIKALEHVEVSEVYHRGAFNDRPFDEIHYGHIMALSDLLRPFHHFLSRRLTAEYGKKLFDDMTGQILFKINPYRQQWQPLINYDLEWLHDNFRTTYPMLKQGDEEWVLMENCPIKAPNKDVEDVYEKIWLFEEELPRKEKKHCGICRHYGALVNHGYWWCNKGHTEHMDAENCEDYDDMMANVTFTATSSTTLTYNSDKTEKM